MSWQNLLLTLVAALGMAETARAADPEIFTGCGKTRWGQTIEAVLAVYPQANEVHRQRSTDKVPLNSPTTEDASGEPLFRFFSSPAAEPLQQMIFGFTDGRLYFVGIGFSAKVQAKLDGRAFAQVVWDKYFCTKEDRERLLARHLVIYVASRGWNQILSDDPQQPDQLLSPNFEEYNKTDLTVCYRDDVTWSVANEAAKARKRAVEDQRRRETEKTAAELGVRDLL